MKSVWQKISWVVWTVLGSAIFALGFSLFLMPHDMNAGGISGLAQIVVEILGFGSVGTLSILINMPLFIMGGIKIGKRFFAGSLFLMGLLHIAVRLTFSWGLFLLQGVAWMLFFFALTWYELRERL